MVYSLFFNQYNISKQSIAFEIEASSATYVHHRCLYVRGASLGDKGWRAPCSPQAAPPSQDNNRFRANTCPRISPCPGGPWVSSDLRQASIATAKQHHNKHRDFEINANHISRTPWIHTAQRPAILNAHKSSHNFRFGTLLQNIFNKKKEREKPYSDTA